VGHALAGTPNIAITIAPPVIVGTASDFLYAGALLVLAKRGADIAKDRQGARPLKTRSYRG
jgi:hypothetical protein